VRPRLLAYRRPVLEDLIVGTSLIYPARRLDGDGIQAFADVKPARLRGLVAKDEASAYVGGERGAG
jgi:hypothetical protein